jgi:Concanavalin A-like lectin/glucanases superfamily
LFIVFYTCAPISGCQKTKYDTTVLVKNDTINIVKQDTVNDTVYDISSGLVAYYNFNGGNLNDSSGYGNNISFNNATPTEDRFGNPNNAYLFDGATTYMEVPNSTSLNPDNITIYAIFKINGYWYGGCHGNEILDKGEPDNVDGFFALRFNDTLNNCTLPVPDTSHEFVSGTYGDNNPVGAGALVTDVASPMAKGTWYKLAYTYDGSTAKFYVNGQLVQSSSKSVPFTPNTENLFIGRHNDPVAGYWFNGVIDEIRIYDRPLSQPAITELVNLSK